MLDGSRLLCWINEDVAEIEESPGAGGAGGAGGGAIGGGPAPWLLIFSMSSCVIRIVPPFPTVGSGGAHGELGSSFAVVGVGAVQLDPLPNIEGSCDGCDDLKLGGGAGGG